MKTALDHMIKEVLTEVADAPPPSGLARAAVRRATRRRTVERAGVGAVAVLVVALVGIPFAVRAAGDGAPSAGQPAGPLTAPAAPPAPAAPAVPPAPAIQRQPAVSVPPVTPFPTAGRVARVVTAYSGISDPGQPDSFSSLLLDRRTGRYLKLPYRGVSPSPDGTRAVVYEGGNSVDRPQRTGVLDVGTGRVRWLADEGAYQRAAQWPAQWSPGGDRILLNYQPKDRPGGFLIVDAETLVVTKIDQGEASRDMTGRNAVGAGFVWTPDGTEVALTLSRPAGEESRRDIVDGIGFYDLTGRATRTLPTKVGLASGAEFAPDGRRLALADTSRSGQAESHIQVMDVATGEITHSVSGPTAGRLVGWYDDRHLMLDTYTKGSDGVSTNLLVVDLSGKAVREVRLEQVWADRIHVGYAEGLTGDGAKLAF